MEKNLGGMIILSTNPDSAKADRGHRAKDLESNFIL